MTFNIQYSAKAYISKSGCFTIKLQPIKIKPHITLNKIRSHVYTSLAINMRKVEQNNVSGILSGIWMIEVP